jgi:hypothetical protein
MRSSATAVEEKSRWGSCSSQLPRIPNEATTMAASGDDGGLFFRAPPGRGLIFAPRILMGQLLPPPSQWPHLRPLLHPASADPAPLGQW